jgi:hypothetical protein
VLPLVLDGPSYGHDFNFHLLNWMEAGRQFGHGTLYPRWAYSPAYNAGEPRFVFYPPASWMLGALIGLVLTHIPGLSPETAWAAAPNVFVWTCLAVAGFSMYQAARQFANTKAAAFGAVLYMVNPYMLFTAYERAAYAELLAAAWLPLLVVSVLAPEIRAARIGIPLALLWLTNAPAAVIGCYTALVLMLLRMAVGAFKDRGALVLRNIAMPMALGTLLGFGLASFYLVPAAWERRFVQVSMATIVNMRIDHNFLFEHTGSPFDAMTHDAVLRTASWIAVGLLAAAFLSLLACWRQQRRKLSTGGGYILPVIPLLLFLCLIGFLLTGWSNPVWQHTPELIFLQFPWRLMTVIAPVLALAISVAISEVRLKKWGIEVASWSAAAILTILFYSPFRQTPDTGQSVAARLHAFDRNEGAEPADEYTPQTADNDVLKSGNAPYWLAPEPSAPAPVPSAPGPAPAHFTLQTARPAFLILNLRDYPAWRVVLNGQIVTEREGREDGLVAFPVPAGTSKIDVRYARGLDDLCGDGISLLSVLALGADAIRRRTRSGA